MLPLLLLAIHPLCPDDSTARAAADSGWQAYHSSRMVAAGTWFARADALCPGIPGARTGLGLVRLRENRIEEAAALFRQATAADSTDADAFYGLGLVARRLGHRDEAVAALGHSLRLAPGNQDALAELLALGVAPALPPASRPMAPQVPARIVGDRFQIHAANGWSDFYLRGIDLGAALPGRFPSEFPEAESTYARWLSLMAAAHANVVRVYTAHPPAFYRALRAWNEAHPDQALWLIQGVWAEPPPRDDYDDPAWRGDFLGEMRRVVDIVHGHALLPARPGHAYGRYDADVSDHTLAYLIGREWEPATIVAFDARHRSDTAFAGRFLTLPHGTPADRWMAAQCDSMLGLDWDLYHASRPIAYTNWPTLDPLHHPTETTDAEEVALRQARGFPANPDLHEYDNDTVSLDAALVHPTSANLGGWFVSYHVYPYYPDFMDLDPGYGAARSSYGPSHYYGYLLDLKQHYAGMPIVISEYGVPSSRGDAHKQPEGLDHGGHDEREMAEQDVRLTREIREAGLAGGVLFAWIDEWFKHNWPVIDLEAPAERTRLWHNVMDAEQNYGLLGEYAGDTATQPVLGGDPAKWRGLAVLERDSAVTLRVGSDASYLYLAIEGAAGDGYVVGIDTDDPGSGQFRLPGLKTAGTDGFEFALTLRDTAGGRMWVVPWYSPYLVPKPGMGPTALDPFYQYGATLRSASRSGGWDSMWVTSNRWRIGRDGRTFPAEGWDRGRLRYGTEAASTLSDWYIDRSANRVEVRIAWGLLNVTDPSSHRILTRISASAGFETGVTAGFRLGVATVDRSGAERDWLAPGPTYRWPGWDVPVSHERLKPAYFAIRDLWSTW